MYIIQISPFENVVSVFLFQHSANAEVFLGLGIIKAIGAVLM